MYDVVVQRWRYTQTAYVIHYETADPFYAFTDTSLGLDLLCFGYPSCDVTSCAVSLVYSREARRAPGGDK